jgi:CrcB protein
MALALAQARTAADWMLIMPTYKLEGKHMKLIEFVLLAVGAVIGAFLRYKLVESPIAVYGLPVNVLVVNVLGSFILGLFSVMSIGLNLNSQYTLFAAVGFCGSLQLCLRSETVPADANRFSLMALNILTNVGLSLGAIFGGRMLGDVIMERFLR